MNQELNPLWLTLARVINHTLYVIRILYTFALIRSSCRELHPERLEF